MTRTTILKSPEYAETFLHIAKNQPVKSDELLANLNPDEKKAKTMLLQNLKKKGYLIITKLPGKFGRISKYEINPKGILDIILKEILFVKKYDDHFELEENLLTALKAFIIWAAKTKKDLTILDVLEGFMLHIGRLEDVGVLTQKDIIKKTYGEIPPVFTDLCEQYYFNKFGNNPFWKLFL